jgi:hypothetical protein
LIRTETHYRKKRLESTGSLESCLSEPLKIGINVETRNPLAEDPILCPKRHPNNVGMLSTNDCFQLLVTLGSPGIRYLSCYLLSSKKHEHVHKFIILPNKTAAVGKLFLAVDDTNHKNLRLHIQPLLLNSNEHFFFESFHLIQNVNYLFKIQRKMPA